MTNRRRYVVHPIWLFGYVLRPISSWNPMSEMPCWNMEQPHQPDEPHCCQSWTLRGLFGQGLDMAYLEVDRCSTECTCTPLPTAFWLCLHLAEGIFCKCESWYGPCQVWPIFETHFFLRNALSRHIGSSHVKQLTQPTSSGASTLSRCSWNITMITW